MNNEYFKKIFSTYNKQAIDQVARDIIASPTHDKIKMIAEVSHVFSEGLSKARATDAKYLSLAFKVSKYLSLVAKGACPCIIVRQDFFNPISRIKDLFIVDTINSEPYEEVYQCTCKVCKHCYIAKNQETGFGFKIDWRDA